MAIDEFTGLNLPTAEDFRVSALPIEDDFSSLDLPTAEDFSGLDLPTEEDFAAPAPVRAAIPAPQLRPRPEEAEGRIVPKGAPEERSYLETIGAGLRRGFVGEGIGIGKGFKYVGDVIGSQRVAELGEDLAGYAQGVLDKHPEWAPAAEQAGRDWYHPERLAETVSEAVPMMASFMIPGGAAAKGVRLLGGSRKAAKVAGTIIGTTPFGVVSAGEMYESAQKGLIEEGLSPEAAKSSAKWLAGTAGVLEGLLEVYGAGKVLEMSGLTRLGKEGVKDVITKTEILKSIARGAGEIAKIEALEEFSQTVKDNAIKRFGWDEGQDLFEGGLQAFTVGGIMGGLLGAGGRAYGELTTPREKEKAVKPPIQSLPKSVAERIVKDQTIHPRTAEEIAVVFNNQLPTDKDPEEYEEFWNKSLDDMGIGVDDEVSEEVIKREYQRAPVIIGEEEVEAPVRLNRERLDAALETAPALRTSEDKLAIRDAMNQGVDIEIVSVFEGRKPTPAPEGEVTIKTGEAVVDEIKEKVAAQEAKAIPLVEEAPVVEPTPIVEPALAVEEVIPEPVVAEEAPVIPVLAEEEVVPEPEIEVEEEFPVIEIDELVVNDKGRMELDDIQKEVLENIRAEVEVGQAGRKIRTQTPEGIVSASEPSTFPEYFQNKGYKKKEILKAIDKAIAGKVRLGKTQVLNIQDLYAGFQQVRPEVYKGIREERLAPPVPETILAETLGRGDSFTRGTETFTVRGISDDGDIITLVNQEGTPSTIMADEMIEYDENTLQKGEVAPEEVAREALELAPTPAVKAPPKKEEQIDLLKVQPKFPEAPLKGKEAERVELIDVPKEIAAEKAQVKIEEVAKPKRKRLKEFVEEIEAEEPVLKRKATKAQALKLAEKLGAEIEYDSDMGNAMAYSPKNKIWDASSASTISINYNSGEMSAVWEDLIDEMEGGLSDAPEGYEGWWVEGAPEFKRKDFLGEALPVEEFKEVPLRADIEAAIDIITTKWKNAPPVHVRSRINQLPSHLQDAVTLAKGEGDIEGLYDPKTKSTYLIAGNIDSLVRAKEVLFHETLGHYGIRGLLGEDITPVLNQVYNKNRKEAQKIARQYGFDLTTAEGRQSAAEEVLANIAQTNTDPGLIVKAIAAIRNWLRKMGFDIKLSDKDIQNMIADAAQFVRAGKKPLSLTGPPVFARKEDEPRIELEAKKPGRIEELRAKFDTQKAGQAQSVAQAVAEEAKASPSAKPKPVPAGASALERAESKIGPSMAGQSMWGKLLNMKENLGVKLRQMAVDRFASIREFSEKGYILSRMTTSATGALEAFLMHGKIKVDKEGGMTADTTGKGLFSVFEPLGEEFEQFLKWVAGNRASKLKTEDKERLFRDDEIAALIGLADGTMEDGRNRKQVYDKVFREFRAFQNSLLDVAVEAGTVSPEARDIWKDDFYVPFYRVLQEDQDVSGPKTLDALVGQKAFHKLKGADVPLNDLLHNVLMNSHHLIDSAMKNNAARITLQDAKKMGIAEEVSEKEKGKKAVFALENGEKVWYDISEPLVYDAITSLNWEGFNNPAMRAMRKFKRIFTAGITASPEFRVANLLRDTVHSVAVGKMDYNMIKNVMVGTKGTKKDSLTKAKMLAGGGEIHFGHLHGSDPEGARLLINKGVKKHTILDSQSAIDSFKHGWGAAWDKWQDFGSRMENINRAALYEKRVGEVGHLQASFEARDLMDFTNYGAAPAVRFLVQAVPFLNARLQGLDKMGRAAMDKDQRGQFLAVTGAVSLASMALYLAYKDDEDYKAREEWDKDTYWWFKLPGSDVAYRIPKPFEVGAIGTMAERTLEQIADDKAHGELFLDRLKHMLTQTFAFSGVPQLVQPALDIYSNKNPFTKREIESKYMQKLSPTQRQRAWTSDTAIAMSKGMDKVLWKDATLSPVQIEHLVKGYLGWIGAQALLVADNVVTRPLTDAPVKPAKKIDDYPGIGRFIRTDPPRNTKYATAFYEQLQETNEAFNDIRHLRKLKEFEAAKELRLRTIDKLKWRKYLNNVQKQLIDIGKRMTLIQRDRKLTAEQKRDRLDLLQRRKNRLVKIAAVKIEGKIK